MSKSIKRVRNVLRQTWLTPEEDAIVQRKMASAGVTISELIRLALFGYKPPRRQDETAALSRLSREIGKIGSNIDPGYRLPPQRRAPRRHHRRQPRRRPA